MREENTATTAEKTLHTTVTSSIRDVVCARLCTVGWSFSKGPTRERHGEPTCTQPRNNSASPRLMLH